jgi:peptidoglycan endopeptidase LytE
MNTPSPLIPQGTTPARAKASFFFKVLMILTVHVVVIGGMLLQGCKDTKDTSSSSTTTTDSNSTAAATNTDTLPPVTSTTSLSNNPGVNPAPTVPGQPAPTAQQPPVLQPVAPPVQPVPTMAPPAATGGTEYVIASGDTLGKIAKKNGLSLKALMDANPGINPKKLHIGQKVQLPGGGAAAASTATPSAVGADVGASVEAPALYTVKSGDTLGKIAKAHHTSVKKLMALNDLKTTSIHVAQKLKVPAAATAAAEAPAAPAAPTTMAPVQAAPPPVTAAPTSTPAPAPAPANQ